jgi:hypothetical protein
LSFILISTDLETQTYMHAQVLDWTVADVVFVHSACFTSELIERLSVLAEGLARGALILAVSKPLVSPELEILFTWGCVMSYSNAAVPVFVERRR